MQDAEWYGREEISLQLFGEVEIGKWDADTTCLAVLRGQGCVLPGGQGSTTTVIGNSKSGDSIYDVYYE